MIAQGHPKTLFMRARTLKKYGTACKRNAPKDASDF